MTKKFIATVLAASITLTAATVVPVQAKNNDAAKILGGLAALYIISRIIKDNKQPTPAASNMRLPKRCLTTLYTLGGNHRAYRASCLATYAPHLNLPNQCKGIYATDPMPTRAYKPNCLYQYGYWVPSH